MFANMNVLSHVDSLQRQIAPRQFLSVDDSIGMSPKAWCNSLLRLHAYPTGQLKYSCNPWREVGQSHKQEVIWTDWKRWKEHATECPRSVAVSARVHSAKVPSLMMYKVTRTAITTWSCWITHFYLFSSPLSHKSIVSGALLIIPGMVEDCTGIR